MRKPPRELRTLKPETLSARLTHVHSGLKSNTTRLRNVMSQQAIDDIEHTEQGKKLRRELWALKSKLEGLLPWLARIRNDVRADEVALRDKKKLEALGVDPAEVLAR